MITWRLGCSDAVTALIADILQTVLLSEFLRCSTFFFPVVFRVLLALLPSLLYHTVRCNAHLFGGISYMDFSDVCIRANVPEKRIFASLTGAACVNHNGHYGWQQLESGVASSWS